MALALAPSLVIADAHRLITAGLSKLLSPNFRVFSTVADGRGLVEAAQRFQPDLILTELAMPVMNGLEAINRIHRAMPWMRILCLSSHHDDDMVRDCFQKGASGFIPKTASADELVHGLRSVLTGDIYLSPLLPQSARLFSDSVSVPAVETPLGNHQVTERQIDVLQLLAEGKTMKEIAAVLNLTTRTVAFHKYRLMSRLNLVTNAAVVQYAMEHRVVLA